MSDQPAGPEFSEEEQAALREARIVLFEGRVIFDAQAPVDDITLEKLRKVCTGPLPEELVALCTRAMARERADRLPHGRRRRDGRHQHQPAGSGTAALSAQDR